MTSTLPSLDEVLTSRRLDDATDQLTVAAGFGQGKATFGGLVVGAAVRSMEARVQDPTRRLRSVSAQLMGAPMPGEATIRVRVLRGTASLTTVSADLEQNGLLMTHVVGLFAKDRPIQSAWQTLTAPVVPPWQDVEVLDMNNPFAPEFTRHFEFRTLGPVPSSDSPEPTLGYLRPHTRAARRDAGYVCALIDVWWLAAFSRMDTLRPAATSTFNAELHAPLEGLDPDAPLLHRGESHVMRDGYSTETRELWGVDGRLISTCTQLVTVIK